MNPWIEALGVMGLAGVGALGGSWCSRLPGRAWSFGYWIPLGIIFLVSLSHRLPALQFIRPTSWLVAGRTEFALIALVGCMILTAPLPRLPHQRDRLAVAFLLVLIVGKFAVWPFLAPAFNQKELKALSPRFDSWGVCLQNTDYTCGPAASVTALRQLGVTTTEGELAIWAGTTAATGTPPDVLAQMLHERFASEGLEVSYRTFNDVKELKQFSTFIALVKFSLLLDHYVTVLEVGEDGIMIGDPLVGREKWTHEEFIRRWRFAGVGLNRRGG